MSGITITSHHGAVATEAGIAFYYMRKVTSVPVDMGLDEKDGERLRFIHGAIADGAMAFRWEYKFLAIFMVVFAAIIAILIDDSHTPDYREGIYTAIAFLFGAAISIASGYIGMMVATQGNARTTVAAKEISPKLRHGDKRGRRNGFRAGGPRRARVGDYLRGDEFPAVGTRA